MQTKEEFRCLQLLAGRDDYDASPLRSLSRTSEDLRQVRRLLSLACVYDEPGGCGEGGCGGPAEPEGPGGTCSTKPGPKGCSTAEIPRSRRGWMRPRWLNLLRSSNPAPALSMTLEHDGGAAGDDLTFNGGSKTGSVLSLTRGPSPGCLQRPAFHASPGAQGDETAMAGRSALQIGLSVRRGVRRQGDRCGPDAAMVAGCHSAMGGHWNKEPASQGDPPDRCKRRSGRRPDGPRRGTHPAR